MKLFVRIALFLFLLTPLNSKADVITSVSISGLTKTKESYLRDIIFCKKGAEFSYELLKEDELILRNLNLFFHVSSSYERDSTDIGWDVYFKVEEAKYLYPILSISGFREQLKIQAGFNQINFRGRAESVGLVYQYYDRHSISFFYNANKHKNQKTGHELALTKYSTVEPLYFADTATNFNFDNYNVSLGGHYWIGKFMKVGLGGMYMYEKYKQLDTTVFDLGQFDFFFHKYQIRGFFEFNKLNQNYERVEGFRDYTYLETIQTIDYPGISFIKFTNDLSWNKEIGERGNLSLHNRFGISTNNNSPFSPFVLDGFLNVRGVGNRISRGTAEAILNAEYRHTIWDHKWFYLQLAGFTDFGTLRQPGDRLVDMFNYNEMKLFLGGGLRVHSKVFYKVIFRVDYSVNPINPQEHGLTFGVGHFF
jgi:outer membrane protein insertion porin family